MIFKRVDFPEPFLLPRIPKKSPFSTSKEISLRTCCSLYPLIPLKRLTRAVRRLLVDSVGNLKYLLTWSTLLQFVYLSLENLRKFLSMFVKVSKASNENKNWQDIRNQNQELIFNQKPDRGVGLINQEITHVLE